MKLIAQGARIYRINCDALTYSLPSGQQSSLDVSASAGSSFKHEYQDIKSLAQLGMNTMSVLHINVAGEKEASLKAGGIIQREEITAQLTHEAMVAMVESSIANHVAGKEQVDLKVPNIRSRKNGLQPQKVRSECSIAMKSVFLRRQLVDPSFPYVTLPFGFKDTGDYTKHVNPFTDKM